MVGQRHTIVAVDIAPVPNHIVWVWKPIIHWLLSWSHFNGLLLLLNLLLPCQLVFVKLIFGCVLLNFVLSFEVEVVLDWVVLLESFVGFRQLSAFINNHLDFVKVGTKVF